MTEDAPAGITIDSSTGALTITTGFDYEELTQNGGEPEFTFTVAATDTNGATSQCEVTITVTDVENEEGNAHPPRFVKYDFEASEWVETTSYEFSVPASHQKSAPLGTVKAEDQDESDTITYSLVGDNSAKFRITDSGEIYLRENEQITANTMDLTVQATDGSLDQAHTVQATVTITIGRATTILVMDLSSLPDETNPYGLTSDDWARFQGRSSYLARRDARNGNEW